jgi:cytochrome b6-f complex iron-sulfur subunit
VKRVDRYVADLLRRRRPRGFAATEEDAEVLRTAITLSAGRVGADLPSEDFVGSLHRRLAEDLAEPPRPAPTRLRSRRGFLAVAGGSVASAALAVAVTTQLDSGGAAADGQTELDPTDGTWHRVAASDELPEGAVRPYQTGVLSGFLRRTGGQVESVSRICTHQGCTLTYDQSGERYDCPCHRTTFSLEGQVLRHQLPVRPAPLPRIRVREQDGAIEVFLPV